MPTAAEEEDDEEEEGDNAEGSDETDTETDSTKEATHHALWQVCYVQFQDEFFHQKTTVGVHCWRKQGKCGNFNYLSVHL